MAPPKGKRVPKDWVFIKELYRSGYSLRQICERYQQAFPAEKLWPETVRKHAKAKGWKKDLEPAIREKLQEKLTRQTGKTVVVREGEEQSDERSDEEIVDDVAQAQAALILEHRKAGESMRRTIMDLQHELENSPTMVVLRKAKGGKTEQIDVPVPMKDRVAAARDLSMALTKAVDVERISHNLNDRFTLGTGTIELKMNHPGADPVPDGV